MEFREEEEGDRETEAEEEKKREKHVCFFAPSSFLPFFLPLYFSSSPPQSNMGYFLPSFLLFPSQFLLFPVLSAPSSSSSHFPTATTRPSPHGSEGTSFSFSDRRRIAEGINLPFLSFLSLFSSPFSLFAVVASSFHSLKRTQPTDPTNQPRKREREIRLA